MISNNVNIKYVFVNVLIVEVVLGVLYFVLKYSNSSFFNIGFINAKFVLALFTFFFLFLVLSGRQFFVYNNNDENSIYIENYNYPFGSIFKFLNVIDYLPKLDLQSVKLSRFLFYRYLIITLQSGEGKEEVKKYNLTFVGEKNASIIKNSIKKLIEKNKSS